MCDHCNHKEKEHFVSEKKYRLADFFNAHWDTYCKKPTKYIEPWQYKAVDAIRLCRTAALGIDYYSCPQCGEVSEVRHNCKNRFCPTCSWLDTVKWSERIKSQMLNIPHRHVVFTLPHKLIPLIKDNARAIYNILGRASAGTLKNWILKKYGIKIGIISVLHTFGEKKNLHVHIHMLVSWGGIDIKTGGLAKIESNYANYNHLQKKFRCLFEDELIQMFDKGKLNHNFKDRIEFMRYIKQINNNNWQIHLEPPMKTLVEVIRYIARYSKRACLSESKITNIDGEYLSFRHKDYKDRVEANNPKSQAKEKELRLHYRQFFPLLLQHVPLPNFRIVKYYGNYAVFKKIPQEYKIPQEEKPLSEELTTDYQTNEKNPKYCSSCTCAKIYVYTIIDIRFKSERIEAFDIHKHKSIIYQRMFTKNDSEKLKQVA